MSLDLINRPIILVEDNPIDLDLTLRAFNGRKLVNPIEVARDGEEANFLINSWDESKPIPVVILLDLKLPKVSGFEVLKNIRKNSKFAHVPVVVLTSSSEEKDIELAYEFGANSYIVKPVDFDKFIEVAKHIEIYWSAINKPYI
jgi:hypothetical protein